MWVPTAAAHVHVFLCTYTRVGMGTWAWPMVWRKLYLASAWPSGTTNDKTTETTTTTYLILLYTARPPVLYRHLIGIAKDLKRSLTVMHLCRSLLLAAL